MDQSLEVIGEVLGEEEEEVGNRRPGLEDRRETGGDVTEETGNSVGLGG